MPIKNKTIKKILSDIKKILQPKKKKMIPGTGESKQTEKYEGQSLMGLEALQEISSLLHQGETLDEMLHAFLDKTLSLLDTDAGAIRLYHFSNGTLRFNVSRGWHSKSEEQFLKTVDGIVDHVYHTGQPYICREYISDPIKENRSSKDGAGFSCLSKQPKAKEYCLSLCPCRVRKS